MVDGQGVASFAAICVGSMQAIGWYSEGERIERGHMAFGAWCGYYF